MEDVLSEALASFDADSAVDTVRRVLELTPLAGAELVLLRPPADNAVIAVPEAGVVARVGAALSHRDRLHRELELASWLAERGIDAVSPAPSPPTAQLLQADGRIVTWWRYLPSAERGSAEDIGRLLAQLHEQRPPWPHLPQLDPWDRVAAQIAAAERGLPAEDVALLRQHWSGLQQRWARSRWPREPQVVLHGDIHQGNTLVYDGRVYLLDFEDARRGPRQWDVASVIGSRQLGWLSQAEFDRFTIAYGQDHRLDREVDLLVDISLFRRTCWYASRVGREPAVIHDVRHRIATLADPTLPRHWRKG